MQKNHGIICWSVGAAVLLLLLLVPTVSSQTQCPTSSGEWMLYKDSCYKYHNYSEFWYMAETTCESEGGHLVSIDSDQENRLVGRLSMCRDVWIGLYATDLSRIWDPSSYSWTDKNKKAKNDYVRHKFPENDKQKSVHQPLIRSLGLYWYNSFYHERHPFVCEVPSKGDGKNPCPSTMKYFQGHCYLLPSFKTSFVEANFYCQNHTTSLVSVLSEAEMRFVNTLDLESDECNLQALWLGLIKLNPCWPDKGGRETCYQWTDYSGKHMGFPAWADSQPAKQGETEKNEAPDNNCAIISGDRLVSASCSSRHKFACKVPATSITASSREALEKAVVSPNTKWSESDSASAPIVPLTIEGLTGAESSQKAAPTDETEIAKDNAKDNTNKDWKINEEEATKYLSDVQRAMNRNFHGKDIISSNELPVPTPTTTADSTSTSEQLPTTMAATSTSDELTTTTAATSTSEVQPEVTPVTPTVETEASTTAASVEERAPQPAA